MIEGSRVDNYPYRFKIATMAGGSQDNLIRGLREQNDPDGIAVGVHPADSGGGTGEGKKKYKKLGVEMPAVGDGRKAMFALMSPQQRLLEASSFEHRFKIEGLEGQNPVNLELMALVHDYGSLEEAFRVYMYKRQIPGRVIPTTPKNAVLQAVLGNGQIITNEHEIDTRYEDTKDGDPNDPKHWTQAIDYVQYQGTHVATLSYVEWLRSADIFAIGPGDLFTSQLANLCAIGLADEVNASQALKVIYMNTFTKPGETDFGKNGRLSASGHLRKYAEYVDLSQFSAVFINEAQYPEHVVKQYADEDQHVVEADLEECKLLVPNAKLIVAPMAFSNKRQKNAVRHDPTASASLLLEFAAERLGHKGRNR